MKVLMIQNKVCENMFETFEKIRMLIGKIDFKTIDFVVLPEMFATPYELQYFRQYQEDETGKVYEFLKKMAKDTHTYVIGGSFPEKAGDRIYNTACVFDRSGNRIAKYRKIHLFEVEYPDGTTFSESAVLSAGQKICVFDTEYGKLGLMICFDIRYPEQAEMLQKAGAQMIFVPAAFNSFTGPLHWETTFRARAIDNQVFLAGSSPSADSFGDYRIYGHSLVVDPLGKIIGQLDEKEAYLIVDIDLAENEKARKQIPILKNKVEL